jgi:hypothetical protein
VFSSAYTFERQIPLGRTLYWAETMKEKRKGGPEGEEKRGLVGK